MRGMIAAMIGAMAALTTPARAAWFEASTDHFIIDADTTEARIRDFATKLERFDSALRRLYSIKEDVNGRSNRVHVYAAGSNTIVNLCGSGCPQTVRGFYRPRAGGSIIFTAALSGAQGIYDISAQQVLLHEYSHHFMFSNFPRAFPMWFAEGFAEFNANVKFDDNGSIRIGLPANYRAYALFVGQRISMHELFNPPERDLDNPATLDAIYGRSWLLVHYLMMDPARQKQINVYLAKLNGGQSSVDAATAAFGDVKKLSYALESYLSANRFPQMAVSPAPGTIAIDVKPLSDGAAVMMPVHLRSTSGITIQQAKPLANEAEKRAAPYPNDPRVQVELAEAEYDAGNDAAADAAADRTLAVDPSDRAAMLYKGRVAIRRAMAAQATDARTWAAARSWFVKANRADPEAAQPLLLYYSSYLAQGVRAPDLAVDGLWKAEMLAPEDAGVHWLLAARMLMDGDTATARSLLVPIAFTPHGGNRDNAARAVLDLIDAGKIAEAKVKMNTGGAQKSDTGVAAPKYQPKN